jgi:hypothetical protein
MNYARHHGQVRGAEQLVEAVCYALERFSSEPSPEAVLNASSLDFQTPGGSVCYEVRS